MSRKLEIFENVLTNPFNNDTFVGFVREFLNNIELVAPTRFIKEYSNFQTFVEGYYHIGNYNSDDNDRIAIFSVCLKKGDTVERARSMQRNYVKSLIEKGGCAGAIVAFFTIDEPDKWRLSFIRLDYEFTMGKVKEKLTPAKRYSYLVGKGEPCHTAKQRLYPIFMDDNVNPGIDELEEAFSVEKVTNEFFNLYKEKYIELKEYLEANDDFIEEASIRNFTSEQFAKKLMGQIVFLYFIQKKGWLGVVVWPKFLSKKEYDRVFFVKGASGKIIREYLPELYIWTGEKYQFKGRSSLESIPPNAEITIANNMVNQNNWGNGDKKFVRTLYDWAIKRNMNFFDECLEPLFYETLNKDRGEMAYSLFLHCRIPFLNGGLFEQLDNYDWKNNNFAIPNELFSNEKKKGREEADGILDIFDRYNFTMNEDEPMEREVAIDPEMLGKVFENLLDVKDRKSKGAFYTPREIVHYMCQETLINHLVTKTNIAEMDIRDLILYGDLMKDEDTTKDAREGNKDMFISESIYAPNKGVNRLKELDDILANVKVADLAVGSGAFPLGMLNEIVKARETLSAYMAIGMNNFQEKLFYAYDRKPYNLKVNTIKNCIFACDLEPSAVDIAKLRLWLSIVIDDEISENVGSGKFDEHTKPRQLPNLDCNIICGNSLMDEFKGNKLITESVFLNNEKAGQLNLLQSGVDSLISKLIELQDKLFFTKEHHDKEDIKKNIQNIYNEIILEQIGQGKELREAYLDTVDDNSKPFILWELYFPKVFKENGGFDIVIGNPPYIGEEGNKELFQQIAITEFGREFYTGKMDFWYFFTSKGLRMLKQNGIISFIAPNNWTSTAGGKKMRQHIAREGKIISFMSFTNVMIFESASQQTMIFLIQKKKEENDYSVKYSAVGNRSLDEKDLSVFLSGGENIGIRYDALYSPTKYCDGSTVQFLNAEIAKLTKKISDGNRIYLNNDEVLNGIHPHHASVTKKMLPLLPNAKVGDGIFILNNQEISDLCLNHKEKEILHPYYDSNQIGRYKFDIHNKYQIIYTTSDFKDVSLMDDYPDIRNHLDRYVKVITSDNRPYGLHRARKQEFFEKPAIASIRKCQRPTFSYLESPAYLTAEYYLIKTNRINMKCLTCILNSTVIKYWLLKMGKMQGNIYQVDKAPLVNIPIVVPNETDEIELINKHDAVVNAYKNGEDSVAFALERKIDNIVYKLYDLSDEEILQIENEIYEWESK